MDKRKRPKVTEGSTYRLTTGCGNIYITPTWDGDNLIEVFATLGKSGGCASCQLEAITRSVSLGIRYGIPIDEYIEELKNLRCPCPSLDEGKEILSCPDAIAKVLEDASRNNHTNKISTSK